MTVSRLRNLFFICFMMLTGLTYPQVFFGGTSAIVHRNHLGIFVGIDSKVINTGNLPQSGPECKVGIKDSVIFFGDGSIRAKPL